MRVRNDVRIDDLIAASPSPQGAHVEILTSDEAPSDELFILLPTRVRVNGVDVGLLAEGGVSIEAGAAYEPTRVTITLLPRWIEIKSGADA